MKTGRKNRPVGLKAENVGRTRRQAPAPSVPHPAHRRSVGWAAMPAAWVHAADDPP